MKNSILIKDYLVEYMRDFKKEEAYFEE